MPVFGGGKMVARADPVGHQVPQGLPLGGGVALAADEADGNIPCCNTDNVRSLKMLAVKRNSFGIISALMGK